MLRWNLFGTVFVDLVQSVFHNCHFRNNLATGNGVIFLAGGSCTLKNCYFEKNTPLTKNSVNTMGGVLYANTGSTVEILNSSFKGNWATLYGGAIYTQGKKLIIKWSSFQYNAVINKYITQSAGGVVYANINCIVEIFNCSFKRNDAKSIGYATGGVIYASTDCTVEVLNSSFENNKARRYGGAIFTHAKNWSSNHQYSDTIL